MIPSRIFYVCGVDGSGKSTVVEQTVEILHSHGLKPKVYWLRFNHFVSKPLLGLCRLLGLTRYIEKGGYRIGYHDFYRSSVISWSFAVFQYLDAVRVLMWKVLPPLLVRKGVVVLDRFVYDILIDIEIDTRIERFHTTWLGRRFLELIPKSAIVIPLWRPEAEALASRPEHHSDENYSKRVILYDRLYRELKLNRLENTGDLNHLKNLVSRRVQDRIGIPSRSLLRTFLMIVKNWTAQGIGYMNGYEKTWKVIWTCVPAIVFYLVCFVGWENHLLRALIALLTSHSMNWIFNGHLYVLIRDLIPHGKTQYDFESYVGTLTRRSESFRFVVGIAIYGSYCRGSVGPRSDLDVRILVKPGLVWGMAGALYCTFERALAFIRRFPLDIYLITDTHELDRLRSDEVPVVSLDRTGAFARYYSDTGVSSV